MAGEAAAPEAAQLTREAAVPLSEVARKGTRKHRRTRWLPKRVSTPIFLDTPNDVPSTAFPLKIEEPGVRLDVITDWQGPIVRKASSHKRKAPQSDGQQAHGLAHKNKRATQPAMAGKEKAGTQAPPRAGSSPQAPGAAAKPVGRKELGW